MAQYNVTVSKTSRDKSYIIDRMRIDSETSCWEWAKYRSDGGYGKGSRGNRTLWAHRMSYEAFYGDIPNGMQVCHQCDNPGCVNPTHLWIGTAKDNERDKDIKGRRPSGDKHWNSGPTDEEIEEMARAFIGGEMTAKEIAVRYGVARTYIYRIIRGESRSFRGAVCNG